MRLKTSGLLLGGIAALAAAAVTIQTVSGPRGVAPAFEHDYDREDGPEQAQLLEALQRQPGGFIKFDRTALREPVDSARYAQALRHTASMPAFRGGVSASSTTGAVRSNVVSSSTWTTLGPDNVGGRTRALVINPLNSSVMYAAGVGGGVWTTSDGGAHWAQTSGIPSNLAVSSLALDPNNTGVLYAGTGEGYFNIDAVRGNGIFKTTDGGATWTQLSGTNNNSFTYVNKVLVSPHSSSVLYAATYDGTTNTGGVWRSTDTGVSWTKVLNPTGASTQPLPLGCQDLAVRTDLSTDVLIASCGLFSNSFSSTDTSAIYRNPDAGGTGTWTKVHSEANMDRTSLAIAPSSQGTMYALASSHQSGNFNLGLLAVLKSTDGGVTWAATVRNTSATVLNRLLLTNVEFNQCFASQFNNQGWYDNVIAVDPSNASVVWVGGINVFRSDDAGANFGIASRWAAVNSSDIPNVSHADRHGIVFDPGYNGTTNQILYLTDDGGIQKTTNALAATTSSACAGSSSIVWNTLNNGYHTTQFYYGAVYPDASSYFGGLQDNGTVRNHTGGPDPLAWDSLLGGDGGDVAVDPTNTNVLFGEFTGLSIQKSTDGGTSFNDVTGTISESGSDWLFIAPFSMAVSNPQVLFTGGNAIWRTTNQAGSWTQASTNFSALGQVSAFGIAPGDANVVLVGTTNGNIMRNTAALSATSATTWSKVQPTTGYISSLAFQPGSTLIAYATTSSFGSKHIWKTIDGGATWNSLDGSGATGVPDVPVNSVLVDPVNTQVLFLASDIGVYLSQDGGATWSTANSGFGNAPVRDLKYDSSGGNVFAFTHGLGAYVIAAGQFEGAPPAPTGLTATASGSGQITLNWTASPGATSYQIFQGTTPGGEGSTPVKTGVTTTSTIITGLIAAKTYYFKVAGANSSLVGPQSAEASATTPGVPSAPTNLAATAGNGKVTLNWTASSGSTSYSVYMSTASGTEKGPAVAQVNAPATTASVTGLTPGTTYFFVVRGINSTGGSGFSNEASAVPTSATAPAPTGVTASPAGGSGQITVSWTAATGATSYYVYKSTAPGQETGPAAAQVNAPTTSATISGLTPGTTYFFEVRSINAAGASGFSNEATAVAPGLPATPTNLTATGGNGKVTLNWTASSGSTSYSVYMSTTSGTEKGPAAAQVNSPATTATITGLTSGATYYFVVRGINSSGGSAFSNEASAVASGLPAAPTGLSGTGGQHQVSLSWNAVSGAISYSVYKSSSPGTETGPAAAQVNAPTTNATLNGFVCGTYYFVVRAINSAGGSAFSNEASVFAQGYVPTPPTINSIVPGSAGSGQITINWTQTDQQATGYQVYQATTSGQEMDPPTAQVSTTSATLSGLTSGTTYYFKLKSYDQCGAGAFSSEASGVAP